MIEPPQLWLRDPFEYLPHVIDTPWQRVRTVWSADYIAETGIDPMKVMTYLVPAGNWDALLIDDEAAYLVQGDSDVVKKWTIWRYGQPMKRLMECFASGKRFVVEFPGMETPKKDRDDFEFYFDKFRKACPDAKPHIHGIVSYSRGIGSHPYSVDFDLSHLPKMGAIQLPSGRLVRRAELAKIAESDSGRHRFWAAMLGYLTLEHITTYADRVVFEMRSMSWAANNWDKISATKFEAIPRVEKPLVYLDEEADASYEERLREMASPDSTYMPRQMVTTVQENRWGWRPRKPLPTDRIACDTCSLADVCKAFRQGSVCAVPNTEGDSLRKKFGTRSSSAIIAGLQELMQENAGRIRKALDAESINAEDSGNYSLDPELTKLINHTINHGEKVAKLVDPRLRPGPAALVQVNNNNGQPQISAQPSPQQLTATVVRELEEQGMKREDITPEIINDRIKVLANMSPAGDLNDEEEYIEDAEVSE